MSFKVLSNYRQSLFHEILYNAAKLNPDYPLMFALNADIPNAPIQDITYARFMSDTFEIAKLMQKSIPRRTPGSEPVYVGILGRSSYNYAVHWMACQFSGWIPTLISIKNSREAVKHLLAISKSSYFIVDREYQSYASSLELDIPAVVFGEISDFSDEVKNYEIKEVTEEERSKEMDLPAFYLHTSGSTGHPKIIAITHKILGAWADSNTHESPMYENRLLFPQSPVYHAFGCFIIMLFAPTCGSASLVSRSTRPFTGESVLRDTKKFKEHIKSLPYEKFGIHKDVLFVTVPSILIDIAASGQEAMRELASLTMGVLYGGAALPLKIGDLLTDNGVDLYSAHGMTEIGVLSKAVISPKPRTNGEWRYMTLRKGYKYHWVPTDEPERKRLIIVPDTDTTAVINHENPVGFDTSDVWVEHPTMKGWWRHDGRAGDVTVLSNGEKTDNIQLQSFLRMNNRKIDQVLVFGAGKSQNGLIISPTRPYMGNQDFLSEIWPTIDQMNQVVPAHSRVVKELVIVEDPKLPFATTDKGTIREKITLNMYADRIDKAYNDLETNQRDELSVPNTFGNSEISAFLQDALHTLLPDRNFTSEADLFEHGMDSLLAVRFRNLIVQLLQKAQPSTAPAVPKNVVYDYPSISTLVDFILSKISGPAQSEMAPEDDIKTRVSRCVEKYTSGLVARTVQSADSRIESNDEYVIVTGTTGSLGSFLVDQLLDRPEVKHIYCFNRKTETDTTERQLGGFKDRGLNPAKLQKALGDRVSMHDVDLSQQRLNLSDEVYEEIRTRVTHIIHSAWLLNFNLRMEGFERVHIAGVRHLIDLALSSPRVKTPRLVFLSSISTVANYKETDRVPEVPVMDEKYATLGYGLSKLVGERVCEVAAREAGLNATIVRIGQISGSSTAGAWAPSEYNPIMFRSCFGLGAVPNDLPAVRWIPSDVAASVTLKQTFTQSDKKESSLIYYHLENPTSTPWTDIANGISHYKGANLALVPFQDWLSKVREHDIRDADKVPAVRLLEFYENLEVFPPLDVKNTTTIAPEVNYGLITSELLHRYLNYQSI